MIDWLATISTIIGVFFNIHKKPFAWIIWMVANILWVIYFWNKGEWSVISLQIFFFATNCYGFWKWKNENKKGTVL